MRVPPQIATFVLLLSSLSLHAEPLSCSSATIQETLKSEAHAALQQGARFDPSRKLSEDDFRTGFEDAYETNRTEFTRDCTATLLFAKDLGDSSTVTYKAIQTEAGKLLVEWPGQDAWKQAAYFDIVLKNGLDEVRSKHPGLTQNEIYQIFLYGEPGNRNNAVSMPSAANAGAAGVGSSTSPIAPNYNRGEASGTAASTLHAQGSAPVTSQAVPYAADPNWSQWRR